MNLFLLVRFYWYYADILTLVSRREALWHSWVHTAIGTLSLDALDQAARRAALAWDECKGKETTGGASWSKAAGSVVLLTMRRRNP